LKFYYGKCDIALMALNKVIPKIDIPIKNKRA